MIFRTTLSHATLGSQVISEVDGWKNAKIKLERDPNGHSLVEHYEGAADGAFVFYGDNGQINGGIDFLRDAEALDGLDVEIGFLQELSFDNYNFEELFTGQVDISEKNEMKDNKLQAPVIRDDFWATFINRMDTPVNLSSTTDIDGNAVSAVIPVDIYLPSQTLRKKHYSYQKDNTAAVMGVVDTNYIQFTPGFFDLDEMDNFHNLFPAINTVRPQASFDVMESGAYIFDVRWTMSVILGTTENHPNSLNVYIQVNDGSTTTFSRSNQTSVGIDYTYFTLNTNLQLEAGDQVRIYVIQAGAAQTLNYGFWGIDGLTNIYLGGTYDQPRPVGMADIPTYTRVTADTEYPSNIAQGYLLHDAFYGVLQRMGLGNTPFYSEFLGSTLTNSRQYAADGCGWGYVLLKGLQIRQYSLTEKPFFTSFKQLWEGANPILNLSFGYAEVSGAQVINIEQKSEHYDSSDTSVNFSNVRDISCKYDQEYIFKTIKVGYKKWQSEDISGIDDPQTKKTYATILKKAGKEITVESEFIAASLAIETTRRATREKSADHKFDNETFIIAINTNDVSPDSYGPELAENFDSITGLLNSDTRYNSVLTPLRNFLRWANFYNGGLFQYQTSSYKFVAAEGNYDMVSDYSCSSGLECIGIICDALSEKQDISLATYWAGLGYLFIPLEFTIKVPMEWEDYKTIRDNPKLGIGISQTTSNYITFFIKELSYEIVKGEATIKAWPRTLMTIQTIQNTTRMIDCE